MSKQKKEINNVSTHILRSSMSGNLRSQRTPRVVIVPVVDGADKEGLVVFSKKAEYKRPSFL